ncbi:N-acetylmuramoyl-L-alanine amidase [Cohnella sp. GCM10027633]|uniref:N-acetylmuramoyl-L-alanine amidase n=1 Tax=unclassified Cohnella TaxID=2636738 RepID=UPI00363CA67A
MKKWLPLLFVVTVMLFLSAGMAYAEKATVTPKLILDGKVLQPQVPPIIKNNYVMVPVRIITESLGYEVDYLNAKKQVTVSGGAKKIVMSVDQPTAYVDGKPKKMDMPPVLQSNSVLIPLRFLSESVGIQVFWDNPTKSVFLYSDESSNTGNNSEGVEAPGEGNETPGTTDPGTTDPGTTDPGTTDPGTTDPGTTDPGTTDPGTTDPGTTDPGTTNPGTTDPGTVDPTPAAGKLYEIRYEAEQVRLKYSGEIAPKVTTLSNPDRLVIDFPNVDFAPTFYPMLPTDPAIGKTGEFQVTGHEALTKVRYSLYASAPKTVRLVLDLNKSWPYELIQDPTMGDFIISLKKPAPDKSLFTVVLDAGHGGTDPGAQSLNGHWEKEFNIAIVLKVQKLLAAEERIKLVLTRSGDTYPTLSERAQLANSLKADLFLSVHANSYTSSTNGTETYYTRADSLAFAKAMHAAIVPATKLKDGGVRSKNLHVTRETTMPAALLEIGYMSNKTDNAALWKEDFQDRVAQAIVTGLKQYLKLY